MTIWSGSGNDKIHIDATHERSGVRTVTSLNTGLGDDDVTVDLQVGEDGFFVLDTQGAYEHVVNVGGGISGAGTQTPADAVRAWIGNVEVPVAVGTDGKVRLLATGRLSAPVRVEVTRTTAQAFTVGAGGTIVFPGASTQAAGTVMTVTVNGEQVALQPRAGDDAGAAGATGRRAGHRHRACAPRRSSSSCRWPRRADNDTVHGETSTLPLIIFGGVGNDTIFTAATAAT